jgi:hypothetical protein
VSVPAERGPVRRALLADGSLELRSDARCWALVRPWVPASCDPVAGDRPSRAGIAVKASQSPGGPDAGAGPPTLRVGPVGAWLDPAAASAILRGATACRGRLDLGSLHATLRADLNGGAAAGADLYAMLTIAAALLLGRMTRALIHAGAVVAPDGRGWLVLGDARSGKSTACVSLASAGWRLLSDDQVVLTPTGPSHEVEGWLRPVHLDEGWDEGVPRGRRRTVPPEELGAALTSGVVPLAGTVHTSVDPGQPTSVSGVYAADAFAGLVRQSPWLLADAPVAPALADLLSGVARLPRVSLRLGADTFGRPDRVRALLTDALG